MDYDSLTAKYRETSRFYSGLAGREEHRLFIISMIRLLVFAAGIVLTWLAFTFSLTAGILVMLLSLSLFIWLIKIYSDHTSAGEYYRNLAKLNSTEAAVIEGDFSALAPGNEYSDPDHPFSADIDLFGRSSLFQYLNRTVTGHGRDILAEWLSDPFAISSDFLKRQEAIKELSTKEKWRHDFIAYGMSNPLEKNDIESVTEWIKEKESPQSRIRQYLIFILPAAALISLLLLITGIIHYSVFTSIATINLIYVFAGVKETGRIHNSLSRKYRQMESMTQLLKLFDNECFESEILTKIKSNLAGRKESASVSVRRLGKIIRAFDSRLNLMAGFALNSLLLWDYHCIRRLERWKSENKESFSTWLEMLGTTDAIISLAGYAFNNQSYTYPSVSPGETYFSARSIGHPLLDWRERVCNDFELGGRGQVCVITGANMAGKSTFLRTLSVNLILAMNGAPVCAESMLFRPVKLFTSMRTTDSLSSHESYFYAELKRLRQLKTLVENREPVLFILDEILKGTNSNDKSLGSKLFIKKLITAGGTGVIATHDVSLGELESEYSGLLFNKCFEVEINNDKISFDYILRDGITRKMNAAILMKQMGILD
jgi:DNA mismatch repair ATPase MutS